MAGKEKSKKNGAAVLGFEAKLWLAADKLRNNMDAAEYKHVVLGLIFLKYISDTFEEHRAKLVAGKGDYAGANSEDKDEYKAENVFWVPKEARWPHLQGKAKQPTIGKLVDDAIPWLLGESRCRSETEKGAVTATRAKCQRDFFTNCGEASAENPSFTGNDRATASVST